MIVRNGVPFGLAPIGSSGPWKGSGTVGPVGGSSSGPQADPGFIADVIAKGKQAIQAFRDILAKLIAAPGIMAQARTTLEAARNDANQQLVGQDRTTAVAAFDALLAENQTLGARVQAAADLAAKGKAKVNEIAAEIGVSGFGIATAIVIAAVAALAIVTAAIAKIVGDVNVHAVTARNEAKKLDAVIAGTIPPELIGTSTPPPGGGGFGLDDIGKAIPLLLLLAAIPAITSIGRGR